MLTAATVSSCWVLFLPPSAGCCRLLKVVLLLTAVTGLCWLLAAAASSWLLE